MSKRLKIYISIFVFVIGLMMYLEYTSPKPINWTPTYSAKDKIPFGTYILSKEMIRLFPDKKITLVEETPASFLGGNKEELNSTYFIIEKNSTLSEVNVNYLLDFVEEGNDVFIVSSFIPKNLLDTLNLKVETSHYVLKEDFSNVRLSLVNSAFKNQSYKFDKITNYTYFSKLDTVNSVILGKYSSQTTQRINFIKQKYGSGYFYIHLFPEGYSNYFMMKDANYTYAINSLNYIHKKNILWDENKKSINSPSEGIMMYIFTNPALYWAWVLLLISAFFYCLFFGKRLQRIIPIIKPLQNSTVEFTKTIGNLYYNDKEHQDIIEKKIKYFLYFVKEHYFMNVERIDSDFSEVLHLKSGVSKEITDKIVSLIQRNKTTYSSSEDDLKTINTTIDLFYKKIN